MRQELLKLCKNKGIVALLSLFLIILFVIAGAYVSNGVNKRQYTLLQYETFDEITEHIETIEAEIEEYRAKPYDAETAISQLRETQRIYEYLLDNEITYNDFVSNYTVPAAGMYVADAADWTPIMLIAAVIFILVFAAVLAAAIINYDFSNGIYKQLYSSGTSRNKILNRKLWVFLCVVAGVFILLALLIFIMGLVYEINFKYTLIDDGSAVYRMNTAVFCFLSYLSSFMGVMCLSLILFAVSVFIRNIYTAVFVNAVIIGLYFVVTSIAKGIWATLTAELISYHFGTLPFWGFCVVYLLRVAAIIGLVFCSKYVFLKRDI